MEDDPWSDLPPIPPYLFRAASDQSRGNNTVEEIDPLHGYNREYHANLTKLESPDFEKADWMLSNHLRNKYEAPSEFSSWSVSLLWVLVHAVRKLLSLQQTNVLVYVMDTSKLSSSRIKSASDLLKKYKSTCPPQSKRYAETHEYLIHGPLRNVDELWHAITIETLITAGLWKAFFELSDSENFHELNAQVWRLRYPKDYNRPGYFTQAYEITPSCLRVLCDLAECFGRKWRGAMIIAFVTLKRRELTLGNIKVLFHDLVELGIQIPQLPWCSDPALRAFRLIVRDVPEAWQFVELLYLLYERQCVLEVARLEQDFKKLVLARGIIEGDGVVPDKGIVQDKEMVKEAGAPPALGCEGTEDAEQKRKSDDRLLLSTPPPSPNAYH